MLLVIAKFSTPYDVLGIYVDSAELRAGPCPRSLRRIKPGISDGDSPELEPSRQRVITMLSLKLLLSTVLLLATPLCARFSGSAMEGMDTAEAIQREQLDRLRDFLGPDTAPSGGHTARSDTKKESLINFRNPRAKEFFVDGTTIPDGTLARSLTPRGLF